MEFTYRVTGTGWAEARVADPESWATVRASYLSDALGDLLEAVGVMLEGSREARCSWEMEPGEYRWIFDRSESTVRLRILHFSDRYPEQPDAQGALCFDTSEPLAAIAAAIAAGAQAALDEYGEEGYRTRWVGDPFPSAHLQLVQERLATAADR